MARFVLVLLAVALVGCAGGARTGWDGRRGYDGNGDYGYDLEASRSEARSYQARAARSYPPPGTQNDPWAPFIREASMRFQVPPQWIRAVMRQESGGNQFDSDGRLITSSAGAMGLMQVMPRTYDMLRERYSLGSDPYEPRDNILAGTAYIREMYDRYGAPGFLAAYNAGPDRLDAYLAGGTALPDETVNYLASIAPRLGQGTQLSGPLAAYGGGSATAANAGGYRPDGDAAYAGGGMTGTQYAERSQSSGADDPSVRAFDGGGLVTPDAPTGNLTGQGFASGLALPPVRQEMVAPPPPPIATTAFAGRAAASQASAPRLATAPFATSTEFSNDWSIQVGAYPDRARSAAAISLARSQVADLLAGSHPVVSPVQRSGTLYRARLAGISAARAGVACARLAAAGMDCFTVPPGL